MLADKQSQWWCVWCGRSMTSLLLFTWRVPGLLDMHDHAWLDGNMAHWTPAKIASLHPSPHKEQRACQPVWKRWKQRSFGFSLCAFVSLFPNHASGMSYSVSHNHISRTKIFSQKHIAKKTKKTILFHAGLLTLYVIPHWLLGKIIKDQQSN